MQDKLIAAICKLLTETDGRFIDLRLCKHDWIPIDIQSARHRHLIDIIDKVKIVCISCIIFTLTDLIDDRASRIDQLDEIFTEPCKDAICHISAQSFIC